MLRRVVALGCSLALFSVVSAASAADSPATQPATRNTDRAGRRGGIGGGFGMMRRPGPFGGGGMADGGPGPQDQQDQSRPSLGGRVAPGGGGIGQMRGFARGGNVPEEDGGPASRQGGAYGGGFGGGGAAFNREGPDTESGHPFLSRLDELLMALHRELIQHEGGQQGPGMGMRRDPRDAPMARFGPGPGARFEGPGPRRFEREWEGVRPGREFGRRAWRRFEYCRFGGWGFSSRGRFPGRFGPFHPRFDRMYENRGMDRPGFRGGPPPLGPRGFEHGWGFGRFGPEQGQRPMERGFDRFGPPDRFRGIEPGRTRGMGRGESEREEGFRPNRPGFGRFDRQQDFGPQGRGPRGRGNDGFDDRQEQSDMPRPPAPGRRPPPGFDGDDR